MTDTLMLIDFPIRGLPAVSPRSRLVFRGGNRAANAHAFSPILASYFLFIVHQHAHIRLVSLYLLTSISVEAFHSDAML